MKRGAIAFVDFLGFKGIWERHDPDQLLEKLEWLRQKVVEKHIELGKQYLDEQSKAGAPSTDIDVIFVSDTVCIACWYKLPEDQERTLCSLAYIVGKVIAEMVRESVSSLHPPPLSSRGCVSVGEFAHRGSFIMGPAVDEAAKYHQLADGAFIYLAPSAEKCIEESAQYVTHLRATGQISNDELDDGQELSLFLPYKVPFKDGSTHTVPVLNPLAGEATKDQSEIANRIAESFDANRKDVRRKKEHTVRFLETCLNDDPIGRYLAKPSTKRLGRTLLVLSVLFAACVLIVHRR